MFEKFLKLGFQRFLAATAAQEAHLSVRPSVRPHVRPSVTKLTFGNFWHLLASFGNCWPDLEIIHAFLGARANF